MREWKRERVADAFSGPKQQYLSNKPSGYEVTDFKDFEMNDLEAMRYS